MPKKSAFRITKEAVDDLPTDKDAIFWDCQTKGFGVRVKPGGLKSYVVQYRTQDGASKRLTLGTHGKITAKEAEKQAKITLGRVEQGHDPAGEKRDSVKAETVAQLCEAYIAAVELGIKDPKKAVIRGRGGKPKKASTLKEDKSRIARHILPLLGKKKVRDLKPRDINKFLHDITVGATAKDEKTKLRGRARVTGGAGIASRTVGLLGGLMSYAVKQGIIDHNPCRGVERPPDNRRKVRLTAEQYAALGVALRLAEQDGEPWQAIEAIRVIALTGCRKGEIEKLRPQEVDVEGNALRLVDTKTGESIRPLGSAALEALRPRLGNAKYVFHSDRNPDKPYGGLPAAWKRVFSRVDKTVTMPHLTLHGLRHAYASIAGDHGYTNPTIDAMIGHAGHGNDAGGYLHHLDQALIAAADRVAERISGYLNPSIDKPITG